MLEFEKVQGAAKHLCRRAMLAALLAAPAAAQAQAAAQVSENPSDDRNGSAQDDRQVDINEYIVRGNTVLDRGPSSGP